MVTRVRRIRIRNYRSVKGPVDVTVPADRPLVLVGENNAGKSNIVRAVELVLGEPWPGNHQPEDHEYFGRDSDGDPIEIRIEVDGVTHAGRSSIDDVNEFVWRYPPDEDIERTLYMVFSNGLSSGYVSNDTREQCLCLTVGADRRLWYELSYRSKWTLLAKLMRQFHKSLTEQAGTVAELQERFEQVKAIFLSVVPFATFASELDRQVEALAGSLAYGLSIDFSAYDPSNFFHALRVFPSEADEIRTFEELGTGQEQILAIAFAHAYANAFHGTDRTLLLVIEEPEAHLHPLAQKWVGQHLRRLASSEGVQVIVTTHSPSFISMLDLDGIALTQKADDGGTVIRQLTSAQLADFCQGAGATQATPDTVLPFYEVAATDEIRAGFFARKIILVEGSTEAEALPIYLTRAGLDVVREGIAVIPVLGVGNLAKWVRFFDAYRIPTYVVFDNDATDDADENRRADLFAALQLPNERRVELLQALTLAVQRRAAAFGANFESTLAGLFGREYERLTVEAAQTYGLSREGSKPLVGRFVAEHIDPDRESPAWAAIAELVDAVQTLGFQGPAGAAAEDESNIPF